MKPCFGKRKLLAWLALGELDERPAIELRSHIQTCEGCRRYLEALSSVREKLAVSETGPTPEPSAFFHRKWVARLKAEQPASSWQVLAERLSWRVTLPAVGAAAALVILTLSLFPRQPVVPPPARLSTLQKPSGAVRDLSPSIANYQHVAVRSLDEFDDLLTAQSNRQPPAGRIYTASTFAVAAWPN
jgi:anti-sigma factor RsiW